MRGNDTITGKILVKAVRLRSIRNYFTVETCFSIARVITVDRNEGVTAMEVPWSTQ
jgi:hypothetical protein